MSGSRVEQLITYVSTRHPRSLPGVLEARAVAPERFDEIANLLLSWSVDAFGSLAIEDMVDSFVRFSMDVNFAQARYEALGQYEHKSFDECRASVYSQDDAMDDYLSGIYLTNFLWAHHFDLALMFADRFVASIQGARRIVEIAPGHGGWGVFGLHMLPTALLSGFDISPKSIEMATALSAAAGVGSRASYELQNAMDLDTRALELADACICSFLIEHLEQPDALLRSCRSSSYQAGKHF